MVPGGSSAFPKLSKHGTVLLDRHWIDVFSSFFISMIILIVLLPFSSVNIYLNLYIKHFNGPVHVMFSSPSPGNASHESSCGLGPGLPCTQDAD